MTDLFSLFLGCCGLFLTGLCWERVMRPAVLSESEHQEAQDGEWLLWGWDSLSLSERRLRLALFLREVQAQVAEQERVWLREQLQEARAHIEIRNSAERTLHLPSDARSLF
jgi:hypothetical protein